MFAQPKLTTPGLITESMRQLWMGGFLLAEAFLMLFYFVRPALYGAALGQCAGYVSAVAHGDRA
jgi:hypothetical protein